MYWLDWPDYWLLTELLLRSNPGLDYLTAFLCMNLHYNILDIDTKAKNLYYTDIIYLI